jgi:hypothetical protein
MANYRLEWRDGSVEIEGRYPLLFFHFYGVKLAGRYYYNSHRVYHAPFSSLVRHRIYEPYVAALAEADLTVAAHRDDQEIKTIRKPVVLSYRDRIPNALRKVRAVTIRGLDIVTGRAIASPDGRGR